MVRSSVSFALVAMVSWGLWATFANFATRTLAPEVAMILSYVTGITVALGYAFSQGLPSSLSGPGVGYALLGGLFSGVGAVSYYTALKHGSSSIATTVTALYFVVAATIGILVLGEPVGTRDLLAIALAVAAVVLLAT